MLHEYYFETPVIANIIIFYFQDSKIIKGILYIDILIKYPKYHPIEWTGSLKGKYTCEL